MSDLPSIDKKETIQEDDLSSLEDDASSSTATNTETDSDETGQPVQIAAKEARWVKRSKLLVIFVIICATVVCAFAAFTVTTNEEEKNFEYQVNHKYCCLVLQVPMTDMICENQTHFLSMSPFIILV